MHATRRETVHQDHGWRRRDRLDGKTDIRTDGLAQVVERRADALAHGDRKQPHAKRPQTTVFSGQVGHRGEQGTMRGRMCLLYMPVPWRHAADPRSSTDRPCQHPQDTQQLRPGPGRVPDMAPDAARENGLGVSGYLPAGTPYLGEHRGPSRLCMLR